MYYGFSEDNLWQIAQALCILAIAIAVQYGFYYFLTRHLSRIIAASSLPTARRPFQTLSPMEKRISILFVATIGLALGRGAGSDTSEEAPLLITRAYDGLIWFLQGGTFDDYVIAKAYLLTMAEVVILLLVTAFVVMLVILPMAIAIFEGFGHQFSRAEVWAFRLCASLGFYVGTITVAT